MSINDITPKAVAEALQDILAKRGYYEEDINRPDSLGIWDSIEKVSVENGGTLYDAIELIDDIERDLMEHFEIDETLHSDSEQMYLKLHSLFCSIDANDLDLRPAQL